MDDPDDDKTKPSWRVGLRGARKAILAPKISLAVFAFALLLFAGFTMYLALYQSPKPSSPSVNSGTTTPASPSSPSSVQVPDGYLRLELNEASGAPSDAAAKGWLCFPARFPYDGVTCFVPNGSAVPPTATAAPTSAPSNTAAPTSGDKQPWWYLLMIGSAALITAIGGVFLQWLFRDKKPSSDVTV
ncbi:MAG: hypothetical protein QOD88_979 [Mycobacterium sp.]|jgi:hypothetical protein|nr:hypothetical protein [Mycobacterium sp.]